MTDLFHKPTSQLRLTDEQLAAIRSRCRRVAGIRTLPAAVLIDAEGLRRKWHEFFGGCRLLNDDRLDAFLRRVNDEFEPLAIFWAIRAYHEECRTDKYRIEHPKARLTFEGFLNNGRFEIYVDEGERLCAAESRRLAASRDRRQFNAQCSAAQQSLEEFKALPPVTQQDYLDRAWNELEALGNGRPMLGKKDLGDHLLRAKVMQLRQKDNARAALESARPVGESLGGALSL